MRTALLSALERGDDAASRAAMKLAGRSVLAWQGAWVHSIGCERVICLISAVNDDVLALQRMVEEGGAEFHAIRSAIQLGALVRADDELVMLLDGLVADPELLDAAALENGELRKFVATIPATHPMAQAHPQSFERIDRERSWAGLAVMRAAPVQQLADLPADSAAIPLLLRLALQAHTACRPLDTEAIGEDAWLLATSSDVLDKREEAMIERALPDAPWSAPGLALARETVRRSAPRWLENGPLVTGCAALLLCLAGAVLCAMGLGAPGLGISAVGAWLGALSRAQGSLASSLPGRHERAFSGLLLSRSIDGLAAAALMLAVGTGQANAATASLGLFAIGLARLASRSAGPLGRAFWQDRALHLAAFALAAALGLAGETLALFGLAALAQLLVRTGPR